jgi:hypothetical protein
VTPWTERILPLSAEIVAHAPQRTIFARFVPPKNNQAARGSWKAYCEKWECVTRERLDPQSSVPLIWATEL